MNETKPPEFFLSVATHLNLSDFERLTQYINYCHLGDVNDTKLVDGDYVSKYPDKETPEYLEAFDKICGSWMLTIKAVFDCNGNPTFELVNSRPNSFDGCS